MYFTLGSFIVLMGLMSLLWWRYHILCMLLSLEVMLMGVFLELGMIVGKEFNESSILFIFLSLIVCESSLGLGLLVGLSRSHSMDMIFYIWGLE
uniref:NADH-ubiquinone oxidoreductase chain 4L n=1 Tax=Songthela hangzhouensis TaxID=1649374 RepID=Q6JT36_9ARAC|nr:NADH dehydrogenase subunit 4L [Songthela hangzhouensis]AAP51142.1 NADH dehydrogenase subunit 4L [Songthela hangzhouensis]